MQKRTNFRAFAVQAAVLVLIALVIGACAPVTVPTAAPAAAQPTAATQQPRKIAYVAWNMNNPWSVTLRDAIKAAVEANGDTLVESDPSGDPAKQIPQIETFIGQQVDGIILTPTSASAVIPAIEAADKAGIPVVIVGAGAEPGAWKAAILTGNVEGGHQIGE